MAAGEILSHLWGVKGIHDRFLRRSKTQNMKGKLYKFGVMLVLTSVLGISSYQHAQGAFLCLIDRACKSKCDYCRSPGGRYDPICEDYSIYTSYTQCYAGECDVQCPPPVLYPSCSTLLGYQDCQTNSGCAISCDLAVDQHCPSGGMCLNYSCSNYAEENDCGRCTFSYVCS